MIQFNLLPDIKIQFLKARRQKQLVVSVSVLITVGSLIFLGVLLSTAFGLQKKSIRDLSNDISAASKELQSTTDLTKMLTVQNQLKVLPGLHDAKPVVSRVFGYLAQGTPLSVNIARISADFNLHTMVVSGQADTLETVNIFADTLKFTTYHTMTDVEDEKQAFTNVVLASFGRDSRGATYTITLTFDPVIFSEADEVALTVPQKVTTRSQTEQPLFKEVQTE